MSQPNMTIHEAATHLGVCASTLRTWGEKTGVAGTRTGSGKRVYTEDDLACLEAVKSLRDEDAGWMTIRRRIGREDQVVVSSTPLMPEPEGAASATAAAPLVENGLITKVIETLNQQSVMAERYARAGYQIGKLEAEVKYMQDERERMAMRLAEAEQKLAEMSLNEELFRAERARLGRELGEARTKLTELEVTPPSTWEKATGFFRKWW